MDIPGLIEQLLRKRAFNRIANNPRTQFGTPRRPYLGATILPEKNVPENAYSEDAVRYRTIVANDATRYSPVQLKQGVLSGSLDVKLGEIDTGSELTARDYDALLKLVQGGMTMDGMKQVLNWAETTLNLPIREKMEVQRWQAIIDAVVVQKGDNNFSRNFVYSDPTGHRVAAAGVWSSDAYDPYEDIIAMAEFAATKGYNISRIITSTPIVAKLSNNDKVKSRVGRFKIEATGITGVPGRASLARINEMFSEDNLPPIEKYDAQYATQTGNGYFFKRDVMVMIGSTNQDYPIDQGDATPLLLPDVLGYQAVGRAAGQSAPGIPTFVKFVDGKPPAIQGQIWATTLPVILNPEAIFVIKNIT